MVAILWSESSLVLTELGSLLNTLHARMLSLDPVSNKYLIVCPPSKLPGRNKQCPWYVLCTSIAGVSGLKILHLVPLVIEGPVRVEPVTG